ncbi:hypothetical protein KFE96_10950 [Kordiimonas sp. SCSIO 12603]|uniref:nitrilase-related carbon-nitrogen hydrolase n=1 Tax=Kordiimonas sp. SCSIO 12603 TaxID=2829596 RepID=UPI002105014D|nr:nitrilase-related carbon-nitrogen hydrolase [Kordiimonas sp. SCSIO 12603]UTW57373.1 hypothetical protein KFE96_10950 [Kordiimonas sp. SCSIO 12603]
MKFKKTLTVLAAVFAVAFYLFWPGFTPDLGTQSELYLQHTESFGTNTQKGNVVGIEPFMVPLDYATPARFEAKIGGYIKEAQGKGWINEGTIILLPEHIGTWLAATNSGTRVYNASSTFAAMRPLIFQNLLQFLKNLYIFDNTDNVSAAFLRTQTKQTARAINTVFSNLSKKYGVTIVAGSSALMTPGVYPNALTYGHGPIFNTGFVFGPDGKAQVDAIRKVYPIPSETGFTTASSSKFLPTFKRDSIDFGVLICADSWFEDTNAFMASQGVHLLLVPAYLEGIQWDAPWQGYTAGEHEEYASWHSDVGQITEGEAWIKYAFPAKAAKYGIKWGMTVFLKGKLWEQQGNGHALIIENGTLHIGKTGSEGAAIYNLWLDKNS